MHPLDGSRRILTLEPSPILLDAFSPTSLPKATSSKPPGQPPPTPPRRPSHPLPSTSKRFRIIHSRSSRRPYPPSTTTPSRLHLLPPPSSTTSPKPSPSSPPLQPSRSSSIASIKATTLPLPSSTPPSSSRTSRLTPSRPNRRSRAIPSPSTPLHQPRRERRPTLRSEHLPSSSSVRPRSPREWERRREGSRKLDPSSEGWRRR